MAGDSTQMAYSKLFTQVEPHRRIYKTAVIALTRAGTKRLSCLGSLESH